MKKAYYVRIAFLLAILFLLTACTSADVVKKEDLPISCPDAFADVLSIEDGKMRVFDLSDGITYTQLVGEMFSEEELVLDEILSCDIDNMTPMVALQNILRWKKSLAEK